MRTVIETPTFQKQADRIWSLDERLDFVTWIALNPEAGDVIPGANGARKVRWQRPGMGKRGGARVIFFNFAADGTVVLVMLYAKNERANVKASDVPRAT